MLMSDPNEQRPKLRPLEAFPVADGTEPMFALRDPSGLAEQTLTVSEPAMFILMHFDGTNTLDEVADAFETRFGQPVGRESLGEMVAKLGAGLMLEGPEFDAHMRVMVTAYRDGRVRPACYGDALGTREEVSTLLAEMIPPSNGTSSPSRNVVGLIAPHLDYPRGWPCYGDAYGALHGRPVPRRVCVLGTNHFGQGTSVVATSKAFETPLGVTEVDHVFLKRVRDASGYDLCEHEFDHRREHSVELQVMCLQHVFGVDSFQIVPLLCHDPTGPAGTKPYDGRGVDLRHFADVLAAAMADDGEDTLLVAGADLSHVGSQFGDRFALDEAFLKSVERRDLDALGRLESSDADGFVKLLADAENPTRMCSAGCMFVVGRVLQGATPKMLRYHQAFTEEQQICVSCAAMTYVR